MKAEHHTGDVWWTCAAHLTVPEKQIETKERGQGLQCLIQGRDLDSEPASSLSSHLLRSPPPPSSITGWGPSLQSGAFGENLDSKLQGSYSAVL